MSSSHWPTEIRVTRDRRHLVVTFDTGERVELSAEYLRVESPSADVQGHGPGDKKIVAGKARVEILGVEPVGNYAVKLIFDDLHQTGIYTWNTLHEMVRDREIRWQAYLEALAARGLSREPATVLR